MSATEPEAREEPAPEPPAPEACAAPAAAASDPALAELNDKWLRARAELENVRRAARLEAEAARRYGAGPALAALLSVLDNLQRALESPPPGAPQDFLQGLGFIQQQFAAVLAEQGVTPVTAEPGQALDPRCHQALLEEPSDAQPPGRILRVAAPGYRLHDRLLRPAQVIVARAPAPPAAEPPPEG
jgi:molecular chaperone GrpE